MKIYIIGTGNLAWNLCYYLRKYNFKIGGVFSKNLEKLNYFSKKFHIKKYEQFYQISSNKGIFFLCVPDNYVLEFASYLKGKSKYVVSFSGAIDYRNLVEANANSGIFYIFQTFTFGFKANLKNVPVFCETINPFLQFFFKNLSEKLNLKLYEISSKERLKIHLSGVFINNFVNFLILQTERFLIKNNLDRKILCPIVKETLRKIKKIGAEKSQTGPAIRKDFITIEKHKNFLKNEDILLFEIYDFLTEKILNYF